MNISDYYADYDNNKKYRVDLNDFPKVSVTINDFFKDCISRNLLDKQDVIAWHNMFMEYVDLPDAIYWVRYHESSGAGRRTHRHNNRRACFAKFKDGFSYVFVSNFDVHEVFNMISQSVVPSAQEFLELMKTFQFPLRYDMGTKCEESDMAANPNIGYYAAGVLTEKRWYLAHINAVKSEYVMPNGGGIRKLTKNEANHLFPRGNIEDWLLNPSSGKKERHLNYSLTFQEKEIVKAHFLRLVSPLNYFLTPAIKNEINDIEKKAISIGEISNLTDFMKRKYRNIYGERIIEDFTKRALIPRNNIFEDGQTIINIKYGKRVNRGKGSGATIKGTRDGMRGGDKRVAREEEPKRTVPKIKYKYEFDGVKYKYLRHLALAVIAKYVKDNPKTTYDELKNAFDLKLRFNNKPLIRLKKDLTEDEIKRKRAFIDAPIRLTDGNVVVVNNQFQWMDEQDFKETVNSLGIEYKDLQKEKEIEVLEKLLNEIKKLEKPVEESEEGNNNILKGSGNKKQTPSTRQSSSNNNISEDKQRYEFNGIKYKCLRHLALAVVTKYVKDNPRITYDELKNAFNIKLSFNNKPLIRLKKDLTEDEVKRKRAFIDVPIKLADGNVVVVNNQFQRYDEPCFMDMMQKLGYKN